MKIISKLPKNRYKWVILYIPVFIFLSILILLEYKNSDTYNFRLNEHLMTNSSYNDGIITASGDITDGSEVFNTGSFWLSKGSYTVDIFYDTSVPSYAHIIVDNDQMHTLNLSPENRVQNLSFTVTHPSNRAKIMIFSDSGSDLSIRGIQMTADHRIYTDALYHLFLLIIFSPVFFLLILKLPEIRSCKDIPDYLYLGLFILLASLPLFLVNHGGSRLCIDTRAHMLRIEGLARGLADGQFPVIISPNYFNEYGQLSILYPNLFLYPFAGLRLLNVSMTAAYRTMAVSVNILTAFCAYKASCVIFSSRRSRLLLPLLYLFLPYRMLIMLNSLLPVGGGAAGSGMAAAFLPLILAGCYLLIHNNSSSICYLVAGISGVLNSHILSFLLVSCFLAAMFILNIRLLLSRKASRLMMIIKTVLMTLILNSGMLVVFLSYYFSDWDKKRILWGDFVSGLLDLSSVLHYPRICLYILAIIFALIFLLLKKKKLPRPDLIYITETLLIASFLLILTTRLTPWNFIFEHLPAVKGIVLYLQFPDRLYLMSEPLILFSVIILFTRISEGEGDIKNDHLHLNRYIPAALLILFLVLSMHESLSAYFKSDILLKDRVCGDINTFDQLDYVPVNFKAESYVSDAAYLSDSEGNPLNEGVDSISYSKLGTHIDYNYTSQSEQLLGVFPLTYYDGYTAYNENMQPLPVQCSDNGRVSVFLEKGGPHNISLSFKVKPLYTILYLIMLAEWLIYLILQILRKNKK